MKKNSLVLKIWHWSNSLLILTLLLTVVLRKTFLSARENAPLLQAELGKLGITLTIDQARTAARALMERMWDWHPVIGIILCSVFLLRVLEFFLKKEWKKASRASWASLNSHGKLVRVVYSVFFTVLIIMGLTGLAMEYGGEFLGFTKPLLHSIQDVHEVFMWGVIGFIVLHILGLIRAENTDDPGVVSRMIH